MSIELGQAQAAIAAAWQVRDRLPAELREPIEVTLLRSAAALSGEVPVLRVAHLYPRPAEQRPPDDDAEAARAWQIAMTAIAVALRHLLRAEVPEDRATLHWLGLLAVSADDAARVIEDATTLLGEAPAGADELTLPDASELPDPYDDPYLALVPYLGDQARREALEPRIGAAEAAMMLGPEPLIGSRECFGLSFLRWRSTDVGITAQVRCRLHALSYEGWVLVVPEALRARRGRVRAYLTALRRVVEGTPVLAALRHIRAPRPEVLERLLDRCFDPSALAEADDDVIDFEEFLAERRYLGGIANELEIDWLSSPFRRIEREAGSVRRAMELLAPTILEVACQRYEGELEIGIDDYEECFEMRRVCTVVETVSDPVREIAASEVNKPVGERHAMILDRVRTESWQP
jgi:hypothetical protein